MKRFFYVKSVQTYINVGRIETVYQANGWKVMMSSGKEIPIEEEDYWDLVEILREPKNN